LLGATIALSILQKNARNQGGTSFIDQSVRLVCTPISRLSAGIIDGTRGYFVGALQGGRLRDENMRLKRELALLGTYGETIGMYQKEVDSLRTLAGADPTYKHEKVVADIDGYFPQQNRITVAAGRDKGIKEGMPAVCALGLVGRVQTVGLKDCQVLLLTSSLVQFGAIAPKYNPPHAGLISGENSPTLMIKFALAQVPVVSGDLITTSGFYSGVPKGIPIGRVISAESLPEMGSSRARVLPAVSVGDLREVVILK
jgi:rod shape-determining protein MreC